MCWQIRAGLEVLKAAYSWVASYYAKFLLREPSGKISSIAATNPTFEHNCYPRFCSRKYIVQESSQVLAPLDRCYSCCCLSREAKQCIKKKCTADRHKGWAHLWVWEWICVICILNICDKKSGCILGTTAGATQTNRRWAWNWESAAVTKSKLALEPDFGKAHLTLF